MSVLKKENLANVVNDKSRRITIRGKQAIVPLKFDEDGEPATTDRLIFKRLSLIDLRFLREWRGAEWDVQKAIEKSGVSQDKAERLIKKLSVFREEDAKVKALAQIPSPSWIKSKHVENIYEGGTLQDSQQKSLAELAKIEGAYKTQASVSITQNVFNLPKLSPEAEAELRKIADKEADVMDAEVAHG